MARTQTDRSGRMFSRTTLLYLAVVFALAGSLACGVKSGDRTPAGRTTTTEFGIRNPDSAFEQFRVSLTKPEGGACAADPANVEISQSQRLRLSLQLKTEAIGQASAGGALSVTGDTGSVTYKIVGLQITRPAGELDPGATAIDSVLPGGKQTIYDFGVANAGAFDIMCDDQKVGTFTVTEG